MPVITSPGLTVVFVQTVGLHPVKGRAADLPFLRVAVCGLNFKSDHRVRVAPLEIDHRALHRNEPFLVHRP